MKTRRLKDINELNSFKCGIPQMDEFIHERLKYSIDSHFCVPYVLTDEGRIIAFYALCYDSLVFPEDYFDDFLDGYSSSGKPELEDAYRETFRNKQHYPAMDIAYFAVSEDYQHRGIGSALLEDIINRIKMSNEAGCQFIVVDALLTDDYSAIPFYAYNKFTVCEDRKPYKDCVRMYRVLYPRCVDNDSDEE